ncbi:thioredoxin-dependent thiol peroxidase [Arcobacter sp. CECT 8983]|uniref:thioredoxin-dependent thiol peroxidase n=1 Tax=Arcobacter sp. CECT 8983 TaxID=2044508 RepID=UPI00100A5CF4|nr:thioredoxin-dependent thiol peroxidase [Arcobacter sp. CECT 8983]RXJ90513.1 thioredoxin-dependent thiol peroxidase [Arcobacter sp. CECT 8983]
MVEVGQVAPEFCAPNQDDIEICSRDLKGKWIVLYFYPRDLTPGCTNEACDFTEAEAEFDDLDAIILGVSPDDTAKHRKFIEKYNLSITLLADTDKKMCEDYGVWQLKKFMGKENMGVVRTTFIINPEGKIAEKWEKVNVRKKKTVKGEKIEVLHADVVKQRLQELQQVN